MSSIFEKRKDRLINILMIPVFSRGLEFFRSLIISLSTKPSEIDNDGIIAYVKFKENSKEFIDHEIFFNKKIVEDKSFTSSNLLYAYIHEILHLLKRHPVWQNKKKHPDIARIAVEHVCERTTRFVINNYYKLSNINNVIKRPVSKNNDHVIPSLCFEIKKRNLMKEDIIEEYVNENYKNGNLTIEYKGQDENNYNYKISCNNNSKINFDLSIFKYQMIEELHKELPECTEDQAYEWLIKNSNIIEISTNSDGTINVDDKSNGKRIIIKPPEIENNKSGKYNKEEEKQIEKSIEILKNKARKSYEQISKSIGKDSSKLNKLIKDLIDVKIDWSKITEEELKKHMKVEHTRMSWRRPNYRLKYVTNSPYIFPGRTICKRDERGFSIYIIDTSGSVFNNRQLGQFSNIIEQSFKYYKHCLVYLHDVNIQDVRLFKNKNDFKRFIQTIGYSGGGGTSHKPVFDEIEKKFIEEKYFEDDLSIVMSLTDLYSDVEYIMEEYRWIRETPLVFLSNSDREINHQSKNVKKIKTIKIED